METNFLLPTNDESKEHYLYPCPFCGNVPVWYVRGNDSTYARVIVVKCHDCGVEMKSMSRVLGVQPLAIRITEKWNTRKYGRH